MRAPQAFLEQAGSSDEAGHAGMGGIGFDGDPASSASLVPPLDYRSSAAPAA